MILVNFKRFYLSGLCLDGIGKAASGAAFLSCFQAGLDDQKQCSCAGKEPSLTAAT